MGELNPEWVLEQQVSEQNPDQAEEVIVSTVFEHAAILAAHGGQVRGMADDLTSARRYGGQDPLVYMLLRWEGRFYWPVLNVRTGRLQPTRTDTELLNLIACGPQEPLAPAKADNVEQASDTCLGLWCTQSGADGAAVTRICTLYLMPAQEACSI